LPLLPDPAVSDNDPPRPDSEDPEPIEIDPALPELAVPELRIIDPLAPDAPAFDVQMRILPLVDDELRPLTTVTWPPTPTAVEPDEKERDPPSPLLPEPTPIEIEPPTPDKDSPLPTRIDPDEPELDVPVLKARIPLWPFRPAFDTERMMDPLEVTVEYPLVTRIMPPDDDDDSPDERYRSPP